MKALIEKLEAATEGNRKLDLLIELKTAPVGVAGTRVTPNYTTSLDAALTLVPEEVSPTVGQNIHHKHWNAFMVHAAGGEVETIAQASANSPALAICIAALKARQASSSADQQPGG